MATKLKIALLLHGPTEALRDGSVQPKNVELEHIEVNPPHAIDRRMVRNLEFDVAEIDMSTFLCAKSLGVPITGIPAFSSRGFASAPVAYHTRSAIREPKDLEGRRVGIRSYAVTSTTVGRELLRSEWGVDTDSITWVATEEPHVAQYQPPANVVLAGGANLAQLLVKGEIDAVLGEPIQHAEVKSLVDPEPAPEKGLEYFRRTGFYLIGHIVAIKDETLRMSPWIAHELYRGLRASRLKYLDRLNAGEAATDWDRELIANKQYVGDDPLPFGIAANRTSLDMAIDMNLRQKVIPHKLEANPLFAPATVHEEVGGLSDRQLLALLARRR